jgi:hypothetical protein
MMSDGAALGATGGYAVTVTITETVLRTEGYRAAYRRPSSPA